MERWQKRPALRNLRIAERFLNFELHIILHLRVKHSGEIWGLCFEQIRSHREPIPDKLVVLPNSKKGAVFVNNVKLVDTPEQIIPAFVWLERINSFYRFRPHALYFSSLTGFISIKVLCNREHSVTIGNSSPNHNKLMGEMVKGAPKVMNNVASGGNCIEGQNRDIGYECPLWTALAKTEIHLANDYCRAFIPKGNEFGLEITEVFFGPLDFYADQNNSIVGFQKHEKTVYPRLST